MIVAVSKPRGITSHDVIDQIRRATGETRVGHAGTLDPLAEGVLVVGIGRAATRQLADYVQKMKIYHAVVKFGAISTTDDAEGEIIQKSGIAPPTLRAIQEICDEFIGTINQQPPAYSAIKIRGVPAHRRMRRGEDVHLKTRTVLVHDIEILNYTWPNLELKVTTGPGVYIRALARDIGEKLGIGGYLEQLTRTQVGQFTLKDAIRLNNFADYWKKNSHRAGDTFL
ncbi:tRNA pseudouridine(55) synthase TruB [Candidatus Berkelbacteria bacterium]|nr:tRNA pseudouridine(55) synthase TruB [Candidatus Berkelbacteria bacterium]